MSQISNGRGIPCDLGRAVFSWIKFRSRKRIAVWGHSVFTGKSLAVTADSA